MLRSIRVLFVAHSSTKYAGSNKSMLSMISVLIDKGVVPIVVLPKRVDLSLVSDLSKLNIETYIYRYTIDVNPPFITTKDKLMFYFRLIKSRLFGFYAKVKLKKLVLDNSVDIIHSNVGPLMLGFKVAKELGLPHVWHLREFQDLDFKLDTCYSKHQFNMMINSDNNFPIAISEAVYKHFNIPKTGCLIYNGVFSGNQTLFIEEKLPYFLFVGSLLEEKGIYDLLNSFYLFSKNNLDFSLKIVGSGNKNYCDFLNNYLAERNLLDRVEFLGLRDDVFDLMRVATALIVPSECEAFGRITVEAMLQGCIVIGKNTGGTKEILEKVGVGFLYSTIDELSHKMSFVSNLDISSFKDQLLNAQDLAKRYFSIEDNGKKVYKLYSDILSLKVLN